MSSVWLTIPSKRPRGEAEATLAKWRAAGYRLAIWRDPGDEPVDCDILIQQPYPGYARAVNALCRAAMQADSACEWMVAGGDDTEPDPNHSADEIAAQCVAHFGGTLAVMQPTGDRFAGGSIDRIAGSPWMGREFCERIYGGKGPLWEEFDHMFEDEHLMNVAEKLGVYWRRPDLIHLHKHFMRESSDIGSRAVHRQPPPHLVRWNSQEHWNQSRAIFERLKSGGFAEAIL